MSVTFYTTNHFWHHYLLFEGAFFRYREQMAHYQKTFKVIHYKNIIRKHYTSLLCLLFLKGNTKRASG